MKIEFKNILAESEKEKVIQYDYGCLMVDLKPKEWSSLLEKIKPEDLYDNDKQEYGLEQEPHCTILYGFHMDNFDRAKMKKQMETISPIKLKLVKISCFTCPDYDVLKYDVDSPYLFKLNEFFTKHYPNTNEYDYHPHCTIAYLKKGKGEEYARTFTDEKPMSFIGTKLVFSGLSSDDKMIVNLNNESHKVDADNDV